MLKNRLFLIAAAIAWSTGGAAIKAAGDLTSWQIACGRSVIAGVFIALAFPSSRKRPSLPLLAAALAYAGTVILFVTANKLTTSANAIFLQDTAPLYVLLLSPVLLGEKASRGDLFAVPLFFAGLLLFFVDELAPGQMSGNVAALGSGVFFAAMILALRKLGDVGLAAIVWGNVAAAVITAPMALSAPPPQGTEWALLGYLGIVQLGLGYVFFSLGVRKVSAVEASLIILLEPVLNPIWTFLVAGERPGPWALAGGTLILLGTIWITLQPWLAARQTSTVGRKLSS